MTATRTTLRTIAALLVAALAGAARADAVRLRSGASVGPGPVRLADIAALEGPEAERFALVEIEPDALAAAGLRRVFEITLAQVRASIEREGANWGRIALSGSACVVRVAGEPEPAPVDGESAPAPPTPAPIALDGPPTVRTRVGALLLELFDAAPADLRLLFDPRDEAFLNTPEWGRRIDLQPNTTGGSGRQSVTVRIFEGERLIEARTLRVDALLRRTVLRLASTAARGAVIAPEHLTEQELWIDPAGEAPVAGMESALGMLARTRLDAGAILRKGDIEAPILVRRGERVTVHCMSGGVALRVKARAQADARMGELVECRIDGRRGGFGARVTGRGVVVMNLDARSQEEAQ